MIQWTDIKDKILFSYMETDWTSIVVQEIKSEDIELFLRHEIDLTDSDRGIFKFKNGKINVFFYKNSDQHFDFDPKEIKTIDQWEQFLLIFKKISKAFKKDVLFRPEDNNGDNDSVLVKITGDNVEYNFKVRDSYSG